MWFFADRRDATGIKWPELFVRPVPSYIHGGAVKFEHTSPDLTKTETDDAWYTGRTDLSRFDNR